MKKFLAILLSAIMVVGLLAGCGNSAPAANNSTPAASDPAPANTQPENTSNETPAEAAPSAKGYKIGALDMTATGASSFLVTDKTIRDLCATVGAEYVPVSLAGYDDASFIAAYENMIDLGCDAVIVYTFSEGPISLVADMMEEANVSWFLANRRISDDALREKVFSMKSFIGNCYCEEEENAHDMVVELSQNMGVKNLAVIGLTQGDLNGDLRDKGIARACEECGVNLLTETRGISTVDDVTNAVEGIIASYPEVDGIFIEGGAVTNGALAGASQALANHGLSDKVTIAMVDIATGMSAYMGDGQALKLVTGGNLVMDNVLASSCIINHAMGVNVESEPYIINTHMMHVYTAQDADDYDAYCENPNLPVLSGDQWFDTLVGKSVDEIAAFAADFSIEYAKSLHS